MTVILADIGGTHARFGVDTGGSIENTCRVAAAAYPDFFDALKSYVRDYGCDAQGELCMAVAAHDDGNGDWRFSNRNQWVIRPAELGRLGWHVRLIVNDFLASAHGALASDRLVNIRPGLQTARPRAVTGPGTGLGLAFSFPRPDGSVFMQETHGGWMPAAAVTDEQQGIIRVMRLLKGRGMFVTYEDVASGRGLAGLYKAYAALSSRRAVYETTEDVLKNTDDPDVRETLRLFHEFFGLYLHNTLLVGHAYGGLYLDGGMVHTLRGLGCFDVDTIMKFLDLPSAAVIEKDVAQTPIWVVDDPYIALRGVQEMRKHG